MIHADEVTKLASLSRLALTDAEVESLRGELESILSYIDTIQKIELPEKPADSVYFDDENIMREDGVPHEAGTYTEKMLAQAPRREGDYLKVKKILG